MFRPAKPKSYTFRIVMAYSHRAIYDVVFRIRGRHSSQHSSFSQQNSTCCPLSVLCFSLVSRRCCRSRSSKGTPSTWKTEQKLIRGPHFRTCGTFKSDEDIARAESHFQANMVTGSSSIPSTLNVSLYKIAFSTLSHFLRFQVYWHVISEDTTLSGGNIPSVSLLTVVLLFFLTQAISVVLRRSQPKSTS